MNRIFILLSCLFICTASLAWDELNLGRSSFTTTNDGPVAISTFPGNFIQGVLVGSGTAGGIITLWDSQGSSGGAKLTIVSLSTPGYYSLGLYGVHISSGITYQTTGNGPGGVSIQWMKVFPLSSNN